jgi:hypothetical protein
VGDDSSFVFDKKFPGEKRSVEVHCCDTTASSFDAKVQGNIFAHFHAVTVKRHSTVDCMASQEKVFVSNPIYVTEIDEHALHFALHLSCLLGSQWVWTFPCKHPCMAHALFPQCLSTIITRVSITFFLRMHKI